MGRTGKSLHILCHWGNVPSYIRCGFLCKTFGRPMQFFQSCQAKLIGQTLQVLGPPCVGLLLFGLGPAVQSPPSCTRKGTILRCKSCDSQMADGCRGFEDPPQVKEGSETVCLQKDPLWFISHSCQFFY